MKHSSYRSELDSHGKHKDGRQNFDERRLRIHHLTIGEHALLAEALLWRILQFAVGGLVWTGTERLVFGYYQIAGFGEKAEFD